MVDITKTAYTSAFPYLEIIYNNSHNIASGATLTIAGIITLPNIRIWGELFSGEFSSVWASSAQYAFASSYDSAGVYGFDVSFTDSTISITNFSTSSKLVYVRAYRRE